MAGTLLLGSCSAGDELEPVDCSQVQFDVIDPQGWQAIDIAGEDPFAEHGRPEVVDCGEMFGWTAVNALQGWELDIDLYNCNWLALEQPLTADLPRGTPLCVGMYHFDLTAPEPAEAHMALAIGGETLWEEVVAIPGGTQVAPADSIVTGFRLGADLHAGEQVVLHVRNHGQNSYRFAYLRAQLGED
jgi:hypothetical protein